MSIEINKLKTCIKCFERKELNDFYNNTNNGKSCYCKLCMQKYQSDYRKNNKEYLQKYHRKYYIKNKIQSKE